MKKRKVISSKNLPMRLPAMGTIVWYLILDKFSAPGWVWGVIGTILVIIWIVGIVDIFYRDDIEVIKDND